jgi:hypothetical protein
MQYYENNSSEQKQNNVPEMPSGLLRHSQFLSSGLNTIIESVELPQNRTVGVISEDFKPKRVTRNEMDAIHELLAGRVAGLQFKEAISKEWCDQVTDSFIKNPHVHKENVSPAIYTIGKHLYACGSGEAVECYFKDLDKTNETMKSVLPDNRDLMIEFVRELAETNDLEFEFLEHAGHRVEHGTLRLWGGSDRIEGLDSGQSLLRYFALPHEDLKETRADHPMLSQIQKSDNIYAIILCLQAVEGKEPRTIIWDKELTLQEIRNKDNKSADGSYGFSTALLEDSPVSAIRLTPGDIGILPAHKVHSVVGHAGATRCTLSGFMHFIKDDSGNAVKIVFRT